MKPKLKITANPHPNIAVEYDMWTIGYEPILEEGGIEPMRVSAQWKGVVFDIVLDEKNPRVEIFSDQYQTPLATVNLPNFLELNDLVGELGNDKEINLKDFLNGLNNGDFGDDFNNDSDSKFDQD